MASSSIRPVLLVSDGQGNIYENPDLLMLTRHGEELALPKPDELIQLPPESDIFFLPARHALGLNPETGEVEECEDLAVAAFAAPAHTLTGHPAYQKEDDAPMLPLFAYGAVGFANGKIYVAAKKIDEDKRQVFTGIPDRKIQSLARDISKKFPENRLFQHIIHKCALTYACPAAKNLCLGRFEAPLPVSKACNARCIGCISKQEEDSKIQTPPQCRMDFTPTPEEIAEVMTHHSSRAKQAIYSFGQGCEGEPLTENATIERAIRLFRSSGGEGTVNLNTNASIPDAINRLCDAGLSSMRVSLNSVREESYNRYYRPVNYTFNDVRQSVENAVNNGIFVSLNLLFFPGFTDTELETAALSEFIKTYTVDFIQLRNLNIDPDYYCELMQGIETGPNIGFLNFRKRLRKENPWIKFGYFNPYVEKVTLDGITSYKIPNQDADNNQLLLAITFFTKLFII